MHVCMQVRGQPQKSPSEMSSTSSETEFPIGLELSGLVRLAGCQAPEILLPPPSQCWNSKTNIIMRVLGIEPKSLCM